MRACVSIAILLAAGLTIVSIAGAGPRDPRLEKLAITAADTSKAKNANVHRADLVPGWKADPPSLDDDLPPDCPWQDFSSYTITGQSESDLSQGPAAILSLIEVFRDPAQALGDFRVSTRKGTASCEGAVFARALDKTAELVSARAIAPPKLGDRAAAYRFIVKVGANRFYADLIIFVRDRSLADVITLSPSFSLGGREALARLIDQRLQPKNIA